MKKILNLQILNLKKVSKLLKNYLNIQNNHMEIPMVENQKKGIKFLK